MPHERFFVDVPLEPGTTIIIQDHEYHHLAHVMRLRVKDRVELINGKGVLASGTIVTVERDAKVEVDRCLARQTPPPPLILAQALPRLSRLETIVEKGTELGATAFWLFPGMRSEKEVLSSHQLKRLEMILQGAMKQCGRLFIPELQIKPPLSLWKSIPGTLFFGDLGGDPLPNVAISSPTVLLIGPEKGWAEEERELLKNMLGALPLSLHPHTLRVDTAAIVGLAHLFLRCSAKTS